MNLIERIEYIFDSLTKLLFNKNSIYDLNENFTLLYAEIKSFNNIIIKKIQILDRSNGRNIELEYYLQKNKKKYTVSVPTNDKDKVNPEMIITIVYLLLLKMKNNEIDIEIIEKIPTPYKKYFYD